ncbi:putative metallophosphoesterase [Deinococcus piscis]|uniref:Metallophosphoesterase n=1 Tax=Deinococcus piscis TaxID=394230 RepID=A0ABQ3JZE1_9DEIO|nr:metallophosphoesterase [Deinococcus piscis]GHF95137.1 putative metallophosphoesterase [Deinococcus piscis]
MRRSSRLTRRQWLQRSALGVLGLGGLLGGSAVAGAYGLSVTRQRQTLPELREPLRLVFLTDLHYGLYIEAGSVRRWIDTALAERPDLILLGGDFVDIRPGERPTPLLKQLSRLQAPLGVYGVWGNHDYGSFGRYDSRWRGEGQPGWEEHRHALAAELGEAGVRLLRNQTAQPRSDLHLVGTDDWQWGERPDLSALLAGAGARATLLLTHNPDILPTFPQPIGLTLAGHTHGGQVRLPGVGALVVPSAYGTRYAMGWHQGEYGSPAYVSRGLGVSGLPVRTFCPPEVTVMDLLPGQA